MYRAIFIFNLSEIRWRLDEIAHAQLRRSPELARQWTISDLIKALMQSHLHQHHYAIFAPSNIGRLLSLTDSDFRNEDDTLMPFLWHLFHKALQPDTHPCFDVPCNMGLWNDDLWLEYVVRT